MHGHGDIEPVPQIRPERRIPRAHLIPMPVTERDGAPELAGMIGVKRKVTSLIDPGAD